MASPTPKTQAAVAPVETKALAVAEPAEPAKPKRFEHPEAYNVLVLTPFDSYQQRFVRAQIAEEFEFLEQPPTVISELRPDELFPGVVVYVAHQKRTRTRNPSTGRYELVESLYVSQPIELRDYFGKSPRGVAGGGGLDHNALMDAVTRQLGNDINGLCFCVRPTADRGLKIFDN